VAQCESRYGGSVNLRERGYRSRRTGRGRAKGGHVSTLLLIILVLLLLAAIGGGVWVSNFLWLLLVVALIVLVVGLISGRRAV